MGTTSLIIRTILYLLLLKSVPLSLQDIQQQLFHIYKFFESEISQKFRDCSSFNFIHDMHSKSFMEETWIAQTHDIISGADKVLALTYGSNLVINFELPGNKSASPKPPDKLIFVPKFQYFCSICLYNINNILSLEDSELESLDKFEPWQRSLLHTAPISSPSFFMYFTTLSDVSEKLLLFSKIGRVIRYSILVTAESENLVSVYKTPTSLGNSLIVVASIIDNDLRQQLDFLQKQENFEGQTISTIVPPVCTEALVEFQKEGIWSDMVFAAAYQALIPFNVTYDVSSALGVPTMYPNEEGEFDDFTKPLLDGSSVFSTVIKPSYLKAEFVHLTKPYMFDTAVFITGPPVKAKLGSISVLKDPLEPKVWFGCLISVTCMLIVLQGTMYFRWRKFDLWTVVKTILHPVLDQMAFTGQSVTNKLANDRVVKVLVGTWFLSLIVIACAYKSKLISAIVCPHFVHRPTTFPELASSSYEIGFVFYTGFLENDFKVMNTSVNNEIARRGIEYDYLADDCYQRIFEHEHACLGYTMAFDSIGIEYLVDITGQKMYTRSKDAHFPGLMMIGVSKYYSMVLDPIDYQLGLGECMGLTPFYKNYYQKRALKKGKENALKWQHTKKYYAKNASYNRETEEDRQFSAVLKRILSYGLGFSVLLFVAEFIVKFAVKKKKNDEDMVELLDHNETIFQQVHNRGALFNGKKILLEVIPTKSTRSFVVE